MPDNQVTVDYTAVDVDNSNTALIAAAATRKYLRIRNTHAALDVWLQVDGAAVANTGIKIAAGEVFEMTRAKNNIDPAAVRAIADGAGPAVVLVEQAV